MKTEMRTHPLVVQFLNRVCKHVRGSARKLEVQEEILSHLEAELADNQGNPDQAISLALEKFGDPDMFGRSLRRARRVWPQRMFTAVSSTLLILIIALYPASSYFFAHYKEMLKEMNSITAKRIPRFEAEQKSLANLDFLRESSVVTADAGAYLNSRIQWDQGEDAEITFPDIQNPQWKNDWMTSEIPKELKTVDLRWIKNLHGFDHWDLFVSGPNAQFIGENAKLTNPFAISFPDLGILSRAGRLYLRRALDSKNVIPALKDIRHLARLSYTTEILVGSMVAAGLLRLERATYDEAIKRKIIRADEYDPIPTDILKKIKTTLWVAAGFADYAAPEIVKRTFLDSHSAWPVGSCAALAESAQSIALTSDFLQKKFPFEAETNDQMNVIHRVFEASKPHCRLVFHRQLLTHSRKYADVMTEASNFSLATDWAGFFENHRFTVGRHIPYLRQGLGMELLAISRPDFSALYERE